MIGEGGISSDIPANGEIIKPKKVLRIPLDFGIPDELSDGISMLLGDADSDHEVRTIQVFEKHGYEVARGGNFNKSNTSEIGLFTSFEELGLNSLERSRNLSESTGAVMPQEYDLGELIDSQIPIVAKNITSDRGKSIYLLKTEEQKVRFLAWNLLGRNLAKLAEMKNPQGTVKDVMAQIRKKQFTHELFTTDFSSRWYFEKFIDTPSNYYTSYRILCDAFGKIHYASLIRSQDEKAEKKLRVVDIKNMDPLEYMSIPGVSFQMLLREPRSPFYIGSKAIVSNAAQGGKVIRLNGIPVSDDLDRKVLISHGIDPDHPSLPKELEPIAPKLGIESRRDYPYIGTDFLQEKGGGYFFIEANLGPGIDNKSVGFPESLKAFESELSMMERVITGK